MGDLQNNLLLVDIVVVIEGIVYVGIVVVDGIVEDGRSCWRNRFLGIYESADGLAGVWKMKVVDEMVV